MTHKLIVVTVPVTDQDHDWQAQCSCGWLGPEHLFRGQCETVCGRVTEAREQERRRARHAIYEARRQQTR